LLKASNSKAIGENGLVAKVKGGIKCHRIGGKVGKNIAPKTHLGNNLAKLNDAKCSTSHSLFAQKPFEE